MFLSKIIIHYWKSILVIMAIMYLSFAPPSTFKGIPTFTYEDKIVHLLMYIGLALVLSYDYRMCSKKIKYMPIILICIIFPIVFGGIIELCQQQFFPPRTASWFDWFSDIVGVLFGAWFVQKFFYIFSTNKNNIAK